MASTLQAQQIIESSPFKLRNNNHNHNNIVFKKLINKKLE